MKEQSGKKVGKQSRDTSWSAAADWYNSYLETTPDSYQRRVILPNLLRVLHIQKGMRLVDIACGQGFFTREFAAAGASVVGADLAKDLIVAARKHSPGLEYHIMPAERLEFAKDASFDVATVVLATQNIDDMLGAFMEAARILRPEGRLVLVMMHPAFRIPERAFWGFDEAKQVQYRRVDRYLSASHSTLKVHPGQKGSPTTHSYHRSLQDFFKALSKAGFAVTRLEEWISHKASEAGPRKTAEDLARKEIPLFLMLEATKGNATK